MFNNIICDKSGKQMIELPERDWGEGGNSNYYSFIIKHPSLRIFHSQKMVDLTVFQNFHKSGPISTNFSTSKRLILLVFLHFW